MENVIVKEGGSVERLLSSDATLGFHMLAGNK